MSKQIYTPPAYNRKGTEENDIKLLNIIEKFLRSGDFPSDYNNDLCVKTDYDFYDLEYIKSNVRVTHKIPKIRNIRKDLSLENFIVFEEMAARVNWNDKEMGAIFYATIADPKYELNRESYEVLKKQLSEIISPRYYSDEKYKIK